MWKLRTHLINKLEALGYIGVELDLVHAVSDEQKVRVTIDVQQAIPNCMTHLNYQLILQIH